MGNCQAAEAATVIIQHPGGKVERLYWPTTASDVMKTNPGHYVALVILCVSHKEKKQEARAESGGARVTRVKLLKPKDMLLLGQVYRLITSQGNLCCKFFAQLINSGVKISAKGRSSGLVSLQLFADGCPN